MKVRAAVAVEAAKPLEVEEIELAGPGQGECLVELAATGVYVLDGFGGVHAGGGAPILLPGTPYFGFDVVQDLELNR